MCNFLNSLRTIIVIISFTRRQYVETLHFPFIPIDAKLMATAFLFTQHIRS